jgi:tetratricopeptide (TPR) repeat protein
MRDPGAVNPRQLLDEAFVELDGPEPSWTTRMIAPIIIRGLKRKRDGEDWGAAIGRLRRELQQLDDALGRVASRLDEQAAQLSPATHPDQWWAAQQRAIDAAADAGDVDQAINVWSDAWTASLEADARDLAVRIPDVEADLAPPLAEAMHAVLDALGAPPRDLAVQIETLLDKPIGPSAAARLGALHTRARAEELLAAGQADEAQRLVDQTLRGDDPSADCYVTAGLVAEADEAWVLADHYYSQAVDRGAVGWPTLLHPSTPPARLMVADARRRRAEDPDRAITLYTTALDSADGVPGEGAYTATDVKLELARLLEVKDPIAASDRYADAAADYFNSGLNARAAEFFQAACRLNPAEPTWWWLRAEALRLSALRPGRPDDVQLLFQARTALTEGSRRGVPRTDQGWVRVTEALLDKAINGPDPAQLVLLERALLLDANYRNGYAFLGDALAEQGYPQAARQTAEQGYLLDPWDSAGVSQVIRMRIETGDYAGAIDAVDGQLWLEPDPTELLTWKALAHLRRHEAQTAADVLADLEPTAWVRLLRAEAAASLGDYAKAQKTFRALHRYVRGEDPTMEAWAGFQTGKPELLEQAIEHYRERVAWPRPMSNDLRDLGQMLLVRGDRERDDLADGERWLRAGLAATRMADDLVQLPDHELDLVRHAVRGKSHEREVNDILAGLGPVIDERRRELLDREPDPESTAGQLAQARAALADGRPEPALEIYRRLIEESALIEESPLVEWQHGAERAEDMLLEQADQLIAAGRFPEAGERYEMISTAPVHVARDDLRHALLIRWAFAACVEARTDDAAHYLRSIPEEELGAALFEPATAVFTTDPGRLWDLRRGLVELTGRAYAWSAGQSTALEKLIDTLPYGQAYQLGLDAIRWRRATTPSVALEVRLGRAHHDLIDTETFNAGFAELRFDVLGELGVQITDVRISGVDDLDEEVEYRLFGDPVAIARTPAGASDRLEVIFDELGRVVRQQLYRLLGPDDVVLWAQGWDASGPADEAVASLAPDERVALTAVLRRLLREGVPIRDRRAVLDGFGPTQPGADRVRTVRLALRQEIAAAVGEAPRVVLPRTLEAAVVDGLTGGGRGWELGRSDAFWLSASLDAWLADQPPEAVVIVSDPRIRVVVWRLLAARKPRVRVVAEEELA